MEEKIVEYIKALSTNDLFSLVNTVNEATNSGYDHLVFYNMDELDDMFPGLAPSELLEKLDINFNRKDPLFCVDVLGYICSYTVVDAQDEILNVADEIAQDILEYKDSRTLRQGLPAELYDYIIEIMNEEEEY